MLFLSAVLTFFSGAFASKAQHERSPDDTLCEKADDYALKLEQELTNLEGQLEMLMRREKNVARTWVELGMACGVVSQMEAAVNERVNVSVFQVLGSMSDQVAVMVARKVEMERQGFTDAVKDHIRMAQAVQTMMKLRGVVAHNYYEQFAKGHNQHPALPQQLTGHPLIEAHHKAATRNALASHITSHASSSSSSSSAACSALQWTSYNAKHKKTPTRPKPSQTPKQSSINGSPNC